MSRCKKSKAIVVAIPFLALSALCSAASGQALTLNGGNAAGTYGTPYGWLGPRGTQYWEEYRKGEDGYPAGTYPAVTAANSLFNQVIYQNLRQNPANPPAAAADIYRAPGMFIGQPSASIPADDQFYLVGATGANNAGKNAYDMRFGFAENNASGGGAPFSQFVTNHGGDNSGTPGNSGSFNNSQDMYGQNWGVDGVYQGLEITNTGPTWAINAPRAYEVAATSAAIEGGRKNYGANVVVTGGTTATNIGIPSTTPLSINWSLTGSGANTELNLVLGGKMTLSWNYNDTNPGNPDGVGFQNGVFDTANVVPIMFSGEAAIISSDPQPPTSQTFLIAQTDTWTGAQSGAWDTATQNWLAGNPAAATNFANGDNVLFTDTPAPTTANVTVATAGVTPQNITVSGATNYTITSGTNGAASVIGGTGQLLKSGTSNVTFTGPNTFSGGTTVVNGNVLLGSSTAGPAGAPTSGPIGTGPVTVGDPAGVNNAGLLFAGTASGATVGNNISIQTPTSGITGMPTLGGQNTTGANTFSGQVTLGTGGVTGQSVTVSVAGGGEVDFTGNIVREANDTTAGVNVVNPGVSGIGTVNLSGNNTYAGGTTIGQLTRLVANAPQNIGTGPVLLAGGTFRVGTAAAATSFSINGFGGNGAGWVVNSNAAFNVVPPTAIAGNVLTLTDNNPAAAGEAGSAFYNTAVPFVSGTNGFTASFVYTASGNKAADGAAFIVQNDPRGTNALGTSGGGLGYGGITPSAAVELNLYTGANPPQPVGTAGVTDGVTGTYSATGAVNVASGDPIKVDLAYNATAKMLTETLTDTNSNATFTTTYPIDLATTLGSNYGIVGFSGGTGGSVSTQTISSASYSIQTGFTTGVYTNQMAINTGVTSGIEVGASAAIPTITVGPLNVVMLPAVQTPAVLNVTPGADVPANQPYGLIMGPVGLGGTLSMNVANNGSGQGTVTTGIVSGAGGLNKGGPGTLVLPLGTHTYAGDTNINGGTLVVNGTLNTQASNVNINAGGTLKGSGTINRNVNVNNGGTWSPGNSPGTQTAASATWASGGAYQWELNTVTGNGLQSTGVDPGGDLIALTGGLTISATAAGIPPNSQNQFKIAITSLTPGDVPGPVAGWNSGGNYQWVIASSTGLSLTNGNDSFASRFNLDTSAFTPYNATSGAGFGIEPDPGNANDVLLTYSGAVPEPSSFVLAGMAAAGFLVWRRKGVRKTQA